MTDGAISAVLLGGGGATHDSDHAIEAFLVDCLPGCPRIGYIGAANGDDPERLSRVTRRFADLGATLLHLPMGAGAAEAEVWLSGLDAIYVGGGHTERMLRLWRDTGVDRVLLTASARGVVLSGVSAGAVCWFDFAMWDGAGTGYRPLAGLGLFGGSCCPHFSSEPDRAEAYRLHLASGSIPEGYSIGDGAALVLGSDGSASGLVVRAGSGVWRARRDGNTVQFEALPSI